MSNNHRPNIILIISDEHDPAVTGCYGNQVVGTPHLDGLAESGIVFDNAYCNNPICVPSRMSFLTGRYCHQINVWDNGSPLADHLPTFAHYFEAAGYESILCGRMHIVGENRFHGFGRRLFDDMDYWRSYRQSPRRTPESRRGTNSHVTECGPGKGHWQDYDETVTDLTCRFLRARRERPGEAPWLMVSGFMNPHFPLTCPEEFYRLYDPGTLELPETWNEPWENQHPVIRQLRYFFNNDKPLPEEIQRQAQASYFGLVSYTDQLIGMILQALQESGLAENTVVIYCSDHGEMWGHHGIWQKQCFYEPSVRVPLIISGPGVAPKRVRENVSLVDVMPTLLGLGRIEPPQGLPGEDLVAVAEEGDPGHGRRVAFSEYHAQGMLNAGYMIKQGDYKYCYYMGHTPQLFNTAVDPEEVHDLAPVPQYEGIRQRLHERLLAIVDPEAVDREAKENQRLSGLARTRNVTGPKPARVTSDAPFRDAPR